MFRSHIIWGDNPETADLIKEIQQNGDSETITVIDPDAKKGFLKKQGDITFASSDYVVDARLPKVIEYHYYYIPSSERIGDVAWEINRIGAGLVH